MTGDTTTSDKWLAWLDAHRQWLFAGIFLLYAAGFNGQWRLGPDTAMFATVGRHLAEGQGYTHPLGQQKSVNPGMPLLFAVNYRIRGYEGVEPACVAMWLMAILGLALIYRLIAMHANRPTAVAVTLMVATARFYYAFGFELLTDMPFCVGLLAFLNGYEGVHKRIGTAWLNIVLVVLGVAVMALFRTVVLVVVAAWGVTLVWRLVRGPHRMRYAAIIIAVVACLFVVRSFDPRLANPVDFATKEMQVVGATKNLDVTLQRALMVNLAKLFNDVAPTAFFGYRVWPGQNIPESIAVFFWGIALVQCQLLWGLIVLLFVLQWLAFLPDARYMLPILPLLMYGWWRGCLWFERRVPAPWGGRLFAAILIWTLAGNIASIGDFIHQQQRVPFLARHDMGTFDGVRDLSREILNHTEPDALIVCGNWKIASTLMYYTDRRVVPYQMVPSDFSREKNVYMLTPISDDLRNHLRRAGVTQGEEVIATMRDGFPTWRLYRAKLAVHPQPKK